jgi:hypothetical protein
MGKVAYFFIAITLLLTSCATQIGENGSINSKKVQSLNEITEAQIELLENGQTHEETTDNLGTPQEEE